MGLVWTIAGISMVSYVLCQVLNYIGQEKYVRFIEMSCLFVTLSLVVGKILELMNQAKQVFGTW